MKTIKYIGLVICLLTSGFNYAQDINLEDLVELDTAQGYKRNYLNEASRVNIETATKQATRLDNVPSIAEVISAEQIKQRGYRYLADLLNDLPNNHEDRSNWAIGEPTNQNVGFGFRFDTGQNILLLFNGQRINAFLPGNRFGGEEYLLETVERVEVIRGPGSSLYGANAFTTVVNIISKNTSTSDSEFYASTKGTPTAQGVIVEGGGIVKLGNESALSGGLRYATENGQSLDIENSLYGNSSQRDGLDHAFDAELFYKIKDLNIYGKATSQKRNTLTGFNSVSPNEIDELKLSMYGYSLGGDYTLKVNDKLETKFRAGWHQDNWTEVGEIPIFEVNATGDDLVRDVNGLPILDTSVFIERDGELINTPFVIDGQGADTRSLDGEVQFTYNYNGFNNIVAGLSINHDKVLQAERPTEITVLDPFTIEPFRVVNDDANNWLFDTDASRITYGAYAQIDYELGKRFLLNAGVRLDLFRGTGALDQNYEALNPRAGIVYINKETGNFKLLYGQAFRVPNGFETLSSVVILGNPANRPERMEMVQFQWAKNFGSKFRVELGGFTAHIKDRLITDANISGNLLAQGFVGQFVNTEGADDQSNGLDGRIVYKTEKVDFQVNFTRYFNTDDGAGQPIGYIPNTMINALLNLPLGDFNVNLGANYRADFSKSADDPRDVVDNYVLINSNIIWAPKSLNDRFEFSMNVKNLLDADIQYPSSSQDFTNHFQARGIDIIGGMKYRF